VAIAEIHDASVLLPPIIADPEAEARRQSSFFVPAAEADFAILRDQGESVADFDLAIIGGGINGAGIARDAAGRGLKVVLVEQNDLASGASSASSKLIDGAPRTLDFRALRLVRASLGEREVLLRAAPHLVQPLRFVLPLNAARRSPLLVRLGLALYDHIGRREILAAMQTLDLLRDEAGLPLRIAFHQAYEYSDCVADDARLVIANAVDAAERGAIIRTRTRCVRAERGEEWRLILNAHGTREVISARVLVNAAGAWAESLIETLLRQKRPALLRPVKGSHIVVPRLYDHERGYILPTRDRRAVFTVPFERDFTLIGTTEIAFSGDPAAALPTLEEIDYLCEAANDYFRAPLVAADMVWAFSGVRARCARRAGEPQGAGRDYALVLDKRYSEAPLLTVYGGKLAMYRRIAEEVLGRLAHFFPSSKSWTAQAPLPGGDFAHDGMPGLIQATQRRWPFLTAEHARRLTRAYGTRVEQILKSAARLDDLGMRFGADLTAAEVRYLISKEWAQTADDVLWRRSKLGLRLSQAQRAILDRFMAQGNA
jgi:glycerol-3-phosphate dehydrogenase